MVEIALAVPQAVERRLVADGIRAGHSVIARCDRASELASVVGDGCDVAIVQATPAYLDAGVLDASDAAGVRVIGLFASDADRRRAASVGLVELLPADCSWAEIENAMSGDAPTPSGESRRGRVIAV